MAEQNSFSGTRECNIEELTSASNFMTGKTRLESKKLLGSPSLKQGKLFERLFGSPVPIINEFSDQSHRSRVNTDKHQQPRADSPHPNLDSHYGRLDQPAGMQLATQFDKLLYGHDKVNRKNQILALERERLLTTIQNISAMLQSTVNMLTTQSPRLNEQPCFRMQQQVQRLDFKLSDDFDSLEHSTKCTINELENLLNSLQSKNRGSEIPRRRKYPDKRRESRYDFIVKWLNNKIRHSQPSPNPCHKQSLSLSSSTKSLEFALTCGNVPTPDAKQEEVVNIAKNLEPTIDLFEESIIAVPPIIKVDTTILAGIEDDIPSKGEILYEATSASNIIETDAVPIIQEDTTPSIAAEDKEEFLQCWLHNLKTQTCQHKASRCGSVHSHRQSKLKSHEGEQHKKFISLCKTMIDRVDSMISNTSSDHNKEQTSKNTLSRASQKPIAGRYNLRSYRKGRESSSTPSSRYSFADLANVVERDRNDFHTLQKCLANLEKINMRRTNNALTQTLIIKALRKLMGRRSSNLSGTTADPTKQVEQDQVVAALTVHDKEYKEQKGLQLEQPPVMQGEEKTSEQYMYNVLTKSIMYQHIGNNFSSVVGDPLPKEEAQSDGSRDISRPDSAKEQQKSISLFWMYMAGLVFLSRFGIFRAIQSFFSRLPLH